MYGGTNTAVLLMLHTMGEHDKSGQGIGPVG